MNFGPTIGLDEREVNISYLEFLMTRFEHKGESLNVPRSQPPPDEERAVSTVGLLGSG